MSKHPNAATAPDFRALLEQHVSPDDGAIDDALVQRFRADVECEMYRRKETWQQSTWPSALFDVAARWRKETFGEEPEQ